MAESKLPRISLRYEESAESPPRPAEALELYEQIVWRRSLAYLVDLVVIGLLVVAGWFLFGLLTVVSLGLLAPVGAIVLALLPIAYHTFFVGHRGATPGMGLLDVHVVSIVDGEKPDYLQAFLTTALFYVSVTVTSGLVLVVVFFNDRRRSLHDYLAGTLILRATEPAR